LNGRAFLARPTPKRAKNSATTIAVTAGPSPFLAQARAHEVHKRNGCDRASDAVYALYKEMEPFAEMIRDADVTSIAGLRAKALVAIWDCQPLSSRHEGGFDFDNEESHWSLFSGAVSVTGLSDMVDDLQTRLQIDANMPQDGEF
jgi:hypothetical protein